MSNPNETIERLIAENSFANRMITETKIELSQFGDIDGMSFVASVKALVKKCTNLIAENSKLKEEVKTLKKALDKAVKA